MHTLIGLIALGFIVWLAFALFGLFVQLVAGVIALLVYGVIVIGRVISKALRGDWE